MNQAMSSKKYQLPATDRASILFGASGMDYPSKLSPARIEREERKLQAALPEIPGMAECPTEEERIVLYKATAEFQRVSFVAIHGDDFGCKVSASKKDVGRTDDSTSVPALLKCA